jgi:AcrR family transcriptional regulator
MSPAGLYRYYEGIHDLLTELITDAYTDLADEVVAAGEGPGTPRERLRRAMVAYRGWCLAHPNRFLLIFGTPIPGYAAPEDGPTVAANRRLGEAFFSIGIAAWHQGELRVGDPFRAVAPAEREFAAALAPGFPPEAVGAFLSTWAHFHGIITLEILQQLHWIYPEPESFYLGEVEAMLDRMLPQ